MLKENTKYTKEELTKIISTAVLDAVENTTKQFVEVNRGEADEMSILMFRMNGMLTGNTVKRLLLEEEEI